MAIRATAERRGWRDVAARRRWWRACSIEGRRVGLFVPRDMIHGAGKVAATWSGWMWRAKESDRAGGVATLLLLCLAKNADAVKSKEEERKKRRERRKKKRRRGGGAGSVLMAVSVVDW
ncbi:hypothetical protein JCGZ_25447 [Jatropha curcas]|uniref:Uncharacterized protein n=1 Tax=Jatropha curcas TaxID=180498 RepID=A0A067L4L0_JATCU|nr:hypothetical protein JCGZ_25447 [Jatropha curcas]